MLKGTAIAILVLCAGCSEPHEQKGSREQRQAAQEAELARSQRHAEAMKKWYAENPDTDAAKVSRGEVVSSSGLTEDQIRVVRENRRADDSHRARIFKAQIKALDQRCDSVDRAIMGAPGEWEISCSPGYDYRLSYDANGKPVRAQRA